MEQPRLKGTQPEPLLAPLKARLRRPRLPLERPLLRARLIASLQRLLRALLPAKVKPKLLAALRPLLQTPLLPLVPAALRRLLLIPEHASSQPLHFASQPATLLCPPQAPLHLRPDFEIDSLCHLRPLLVLITLPTMNPKR